MVISLLRIFIENVARRLAEAKDRRALAGEQFVEEVGTHAQARNREIEHALVTR